MAAAKNRQACGVYRVYVFCQIARTDDSSIAMKSRILLNQLYSPKDLQVSDRSVPNAERFHKGVLHGYRPSPLTAIQLPDFNGQVLVKDESDRFGLPAFKVLGGSFAAYVELCRLWQLDNQHTTLAELIQHGQGASEAPVFVTATDGNHGRGLAWFAKQVQLPCRVFVPSSVSRKSIENIRMEGALVEQLPLDYDSTVDHANRFAGQTQNAILIQDTAWPGYERIPRNIVDGYSTLMKEINAQCEPTHIICPVGVGSLADAVVQNRIATTKVIAVEPEAANCLFQSLQQGSIKPITTGHTIMPGLNCGTVSSQAWPTLRIGIAACVAVTDEQADSAMQQLREHFNIDSGPCGAAALAALQLLSQDPSACKALALNQGSVVVLLSTEGSKAAT